MSKRIYALILATLLLLSAVSCGKKTNDENNRYFASPGQVQTDNQITDEDPTREDNNTPDPSDDDKNVTDDPEDEITDDTHRYDPDGWVNPGSLTTPHAIANAAAKASPSVVAITTEVVSYGGFYGNYVSEGAGSGVICSEDGYIITNNHVIEGASTVRVTLVNGDTHDATIIGADIVTDIAVLKIEATGLLAATPDMTDLIVGQPVIAIGNPMGTLSGTVTSGIVSALSRNITVENVSMELLQFDAAVSPGNSGGGLFDINGNLIAIVNAKSSGEGVEGISFAIPVQRALDITNQFIEKGYISGRPSLGVSTECINSTNYESYKNHALWEYATIGSRVYPGLYVTEAMGELQYGDRIAMIGKIEITSESDLTAALSHYEIGDTITLYVARKVESASHFGGVSYTYKTIEMKTTLVEGKATTNQSPDQTIL